jgi:hypothetical protein
MSRFGGRTVYGVGLGRLVTGIMGSNLAKGIKFYRRLSVLCCTVQVEAFVRADHSSKESYRVSK